MKTKLINFTRSLIEKKSVTPIDDGAIDVLKKKLSLKDLMNKFQ